MNVVPSWYPGTEEKPAPMPLLLVQAFVNTRDVEDGSDILSDAGAARAWLVEAGLLGRESPVSSAELEWARRVRESIRCLVERGDSERDPGPLCAPADTQADLEPLRELTRTHQPRLAVLEGGALALQNSGHDDLGDGLFELMLIIHRAQQDGSWSRLKTCGNPDCRWAFYDRSRNQHGSWCNMAVCGNRLKNRELRARRR